jgi:hypothetical protein
MFVVLKPGLRKKQDRSWFSSGKSLINSPHGVRRLLGETRERGVALSESTVASKFLIRFLFSALKENKRSPAVASPVLTCKTVAQPHT